MKQSVARDSDNSSYSGTRDRKFWRSILMRISPAVRAILIRIPRKVVAALAVPVIGGVLVFFFQYWWFKQISPPTTVAPMPPAAEAPASLEFADEAPGTVCRPYVDAEHDTPVEIAPCIASYRDGLKISVNVRSLKPVMITAHVWLYDKENGQRLGDTLEACTLKFAAAGEFQRCGPFSVHPVPSGIYVPATDVQKGGAVEFPLKWTDLSVSGTLGKGGLHWPPE